jgi:hypothetical protein
MHSARINKPNVGAAKRRDFISTALTETKEPLSGRRGRYAKDVVLLCSLLSQQ